LFETKEFLRSINIAKWQIWAACVSDLAVFSGGLLYREMPDADRTRQVLQQAIDPLQSWIRWKTEWLCQGGYDGHARSGVIISYSGRIASSLFCMLCTANSEQTHHLYAKDK